MKLNVACDIFISSCKVRSLSERTIEAYSDFIARFIDFTGNIDVENMSMDVVNKYALWLHERPISQATHATYLRHLKVFIHWLEETGHFKGEPFALKIKLPRTPKKNVHVYDDEEVQEIFNAIQIIPEWLRLRNCAIIALMLDSGLRQNEVCSILVEDISFRESLLKVHGKGNKERMVPLGSMTKNYLTRYMKFCPHNNKRLFVSLTGEALTRNAVKLLVNKLSAKLSFSFSSHRLRHNFATNYCLDQYDHHGQVDIYKLMVLLGHEDIQTTRRYLHMANQIIASKSNISHLDKIFMQTP